MGDTIAPELDRLPWLTDDRAPARRRRRKWLVIAWPLVDGRRRGVGLLDRHDCPQAPTSQ